MKAIDILQHFLSRADWVDQQKTVDRIIVGDPQKEVGTCLVTWVSSLRACRIAAERGVDALITHEPTFYGHRDDYPKDDIAIGGDKLRFIERSGFVIIRNHDVWDRFPQVGIPWSWARFLGLDGEPAAIGANGYQHRYDIEPVALEVFARRVAKKTAELGEPMVQVTGDGARPVSKIGVGTGCGCDILEYLRMGCDCSVVCDDGSCYWSLIQMAEDMDHPVIRVNHGTSEEPGVIAMAQYINEQLEGVTAEHLPHGSTFRLVAGQER